jgi:glycine oxidase
VKTWDVVIIGGGVIGLSLAWRLRHDGASVLVVERHEPAREATYAAGGMIAHCDPANHAEMKELIAASARMYRAFVDELRAEAFESPDLRCEGTIAFFKEGEHPSCEGARALNDDELAALEPGIARRGGAWWLPECSVDPRKLGSALEKGARTRGVDFVTGAPVKEVAVLAGRATGVRTAKSYYPAAAVVNCAGAWASQIEPFGFPTRPVKGQMVCVVPKTHSSKTGLSGAPDGVSGRPDKTNLNRTPDTVGSDMHGPLIKHVVRTPEVYIIPRSDGRMLLGATVEESGFDKRVDPETVQSFYRAAVAVAPAIGEMRIHEDWAGLRPGSPDGLPILGATSLKGYYAATGHFRDGIMLAPVTAEVMSQVLAGRKPEIDLEAFSPMRFKSN